jgi:hypothetical protein
MVDLFTGGMIMPLVFMNAAATSPERAIRLPHSVLSSVVHASINPSGAVSENRVFDIVSKCAPEPALFPPAPGLAIIRYCGQDNGFSNSNRNCRRVATGPGHRGIHHRARLPSAANPCVLTGPPHDCTVK